MGILYAREGQARDSLLTRDALLEMIEDCAYDPEALVSLRARSDVDMFLADEGL
jgi:hypothetical protein